MMWAKCLILAFYLFAFFACLALHGKAKTGSHNAMVDLPILLILMALLYAAGAFPFTVYLGE